MVNNAVVSEVQHSVGVFDGFHHLTRINEDNTTPDKLAWLWKQLSQCDYAFNDFTRGKVDYFLELFADEETEIFGLEESGLAFAQKVIPAGGAEVHYVIWDRANYVISQQRNAVKEMFDYLFYNHRVHHIIGMIPSPNQMAVRLATSMGMKYEGEIRENFLFHGKYLSHHIYGILESEWRVRRGRL